MNDTFDDSRNPLTMFIKYFHPLTSEKILQILSTDSVKKWCFQQRTHQTTNSFRKFFCSNKTQTEIH